MSGDARYVGFPQAFGKLMVPSYVENQAFRMRNGLLDSPDDPLELVYLRYKIGPPKSNVA